MVAEAVVLLTTFVDTRSKAAFVIQKSSKLWELTEIVFNPQTRAHFASTLPVQVQVLKRDSLRTSPFMAYSLFLKSSSFSPQRDLLLCLTLVGAFMKEETVKQKYWSHVLEPLQVSFKAVVDRIPTPDKAQAGKDEEDEKVNNEIECGVCQLNSMFGFFLPAYFKGSR